MPKLVVIDTNSLLYRAFFALPYLTTSTGIPTNAVYGFAMMLTRLMEDEKPDYIVAAFEGGKTFRHEAFTEYKAHRPSMPDDLAVQTPLARELLEALDVPVYITPGYEADDVVGAVARKAAEKGMEVLIVTGDLDTLQLISDGIKVMTNRKGITETVVYDRAAVKERFGLDPEQLPDFKALKGDPSDNIPGVPGVGDKTASDLIQRFGSIENLLEKVDEIEKPKLKELIRTYAEQIRQAKVLATIACDIETPFDPANPPRPHPNYDALLDLYKRLEFRVLARKIEDRAPAPATLDLFAEEAPREVRYRLIGSDSELSDLLKQIEKAHACAFRLHVINGSPFDAEIAGIALALAPGDAVYVPCRRKVAESGDLFSQFETESEWGARFTDFTPVFESTTIVKHGYDLKRDFELLRSQSIELNGMGTDVMLAAYLLSPGKGSHKIDTIAREVLGIEMESVESRKKTEPTWEDFCREADVALSALPILLQMLRDQTMYELLVQVEMPLIPVLAEMEFHGIAVDVDWLRRLSSELEKRIDAVAREIYQLAGTEFNIGSPKQLQEILFDKMQITATQKTKTGYSTGVDVLEELAPRYEIAGKILQYRELSKLKSTYADALVKLINPKTGRIHTNLNQAVTATGRLSSSEPNLQNIPVRTEEGREIRRAFIPCKGMEFVSADYSQIELRVLAHMSGDPSLTEAFQKGEDIHTHTASLVFGVPESEVNPEMRRRAKAVNFGIVYGISDFGLAKDLQIPVKVAADYITDYFARFPGVKDFIDRCIQKARTNGYVETLLGRRRYLPDIRSSNRNFRQFAERNAVNSPIQGTAADIIKIAMIRMHEHIQREKLDMRMILQVHDDLLFEVAPKDLDRAARLIKRIMEEAFPLSVPLIVDVKKGSNWADMVPVSL